MRVSRAWLIGIAGAPIFSALAMANSAGYRYGVSDLAFYLPAAFRDLDPRLFPRDGALLDVQARFTLADETIAWLLRLGRAAGFTDPATIYAAHVGSLVLLFAAAVALGAALFRSRWAIAAFVVALTLRHAVARSGVNTLEGYFHPRIVAFGLCVLALALYLRRGPWAALAVGLVACAIHTTTGLWLLVVVGVAGLVSEPRSRPALAGLGALAAALFAWAASIGPLAGRVGAMDASWLAVLAEKDYLFPDRWPLDAWFISAAYVLAIAAGATVRWKRGLLTLRERGVLAGAAALLLIFLMALPLLIARRALVIQLQPARVFWLLDLLATAAVIWMVEGRRDRTPRAAAALASLLLIASMARGVYLMTIRFPERSIAYRPPASSAWHEVMNWAGTTGPQSHWLAHPNHAFLYGSSVRVSGRRDVFVEATKDTAIAMYDRRVAMRVAERLPLVADFDGLTAQAALDLGRRYDLDYIVTESRLALPIEFVRGPLTVYRLRPRGGSDAGLH